MALIHGKQMRDQSISIPKLLIDQALDMSGQSITNLATTAGTNPYDGVNVDYLTAYTQTELSTIEDTLISGTTGLSGGGTIGTDDPITITIDLDSASLEVDGSGNVALKSTITGNRTFSNDVTISGDLFVAGTATTINTETLTVEDNLILLNSGEAGAGVTEGTAGIAVDRGTEDNVELRWNETNDWWEISNPEGSGATYTAILTTDSVENDTNGSMTVTTGSGADADKIFLSVNVDDVTIEVSGDALQLKDGGITEPKLNATNVPTDNYLLSYDDATSGFTWVDAAAASPDTFVTGNTLSQSATDNSNVSTYNLDYTNDEGGSYTITTEDTFLTGGTYNNGSSDITLSYNDSSKSNITIDMSTVDLNDTFSTGTTSSVPATNDSNTQSVDITGNAGFGDYTVSLTDTFITGGTYSSGTITLGQNDGTPISITGLDTTDTFATGATISNGGLVIDGNDGFTQITATGSIVESVTGEQGLTATTSNGDVTVGIAPSSVTNDMLVNDSLTVTAGDGLTTGGSVALGGSVTLDVATDGIDKTHIDWGSNGDQVNATDVPLFSGATFGGSATEVGGAIDELYTLQGQKAVPTSSDKNQTVTGTTSGDNSDTGIVMTAEPTDDGYVKVEVNGVGYSVGDSATSGVFSYFSSNGTAGGVRAIADIVAGDRWVWNGAESGFELDANDRVDFFYDVLA